MEQAKLYEPKYRQAMAVRFDGTWRQATEVVMPLITRAGRTCLWDAEVKMILLKERRTEAYDWIKPGEYVAVPAGRDVLVLSEEEFEDRFRPVVKEGR